MLCEGHYYALILNPNHFLEDKINEETVSIYKAITSKREKIKQALIDEVPKSADVHVSEFEMLESDRDNSVIK